MSTAIVVILNITEMYVNATSDVCFFGSMSVVKKSLISNFRYWQGCGNLITFSIGLSVQ